MSDRNTHCVCYGERTTIAVAIAMLVAIVAPALSPFPFGGFLEQRARLREYSNSGSNWGPFLRAAWVRDFAPFQERSSRTRRPHRV